ncbi:MAG: HAMP domain-containing histidine kinase [Elusimicrobia bacterium]|nr:HAMP domain-containing histidine kinase [Elusimicrobiota bacterium]
MNEFTAYFIMGVVGAFGVYWCIKFRFVLPLEARTRDLSRSFERFTAFSREALGHSYIPDSVEHYGDITNHYLIKLHKLFPESSMLVFESSEGRWRLIDYLKNFETEPKLMTAYKWGVFDKAAGDSEIVRLENISGGSDAGAAELFRIFDIKAALLCPFMYSGAQAARILLFGGARRDFFDQAEPYLHFIVSQLNAVYKISEKVFASKKDNAQLKSELDAVVRELNMTGSRLIQRAKERKALYEVVTLGAGDEKDVKTGCAAIMNVVARMMDADVVACLLFDEAKNELVVNPGSYGISDDERMLYSLGVSNTASSSVRTFLGRKPFISADAQNDPEVITHYAKLWNVRSLMIVPIALHSRVIGVLRVGSRNKGIFTQDQLEFLSVIADELAILIEMVTLYENLSKTATELAQLNKLKDEFLSTVSHELKTPLTTIKGFVSVILSGEVGPLNEQQLNFLGVVDQSVNRLTHLISNLLDLSRLNSKVEMEFSVVNVKELIKNSVSTMLLKAKEKNIALTSVADKSLPPVHADTRWIIQVLDNLVINAIKYSGPGAKVHVSGHNKGEVVVICVEDNGPGIPLEEQALIFDKFYRCKASASQVPGTGLGLAISKSVVEKHGGKIWLESKPGAGSKFCFALPVDKERGEGRG